MLASIALMPVLGLPAIAYGGFATLILFAFVAVIGHRIFKGTCKLKNPIKVHQIVAILSFIFAVIHGVLGLSILLGF